MKYDIKQIKEYMYEVDELNNIQIEELRELEQIIWKYYKKVSAVLKFKEVVEDEE